MLVNIIHKNIEEISLNNLNQILRKMDAEIKKEIEDGIISSPTTQVTDDGTI
jgi:hypothetical protein